MSDMIVLITQTFRIDTYGNEVADEAESMVYAEVESIAQSEFYAAANTQLNPEYRFTVFFADYGGQQIVKYNGKRYSVYRTFRTGDRLEIYTERKIGA